jgi:hypothetical protein
MKRIVRLTESDLVRLVKRVINEGVSKGPEMNNNEADYIRIKVNSSGVKYIGDSFEVLKPFTLLFVVSPEGSGGQFAQEYAQTKTAQKTPIRYTVGDSLNVVSSSEPMMSRQFSVIAAKTESGAPIPFTGSHPNDPKGIIAARSAGLHYSDKQLKGSSKY